jgi:hypothetical protein
MMLLSFTVRNHASIRDEITVDLVRPSLRTLQPKDADWARAVYPLTGIFGGNATGKSAVLDALRYVFTAVRLSATTWQASKSIHRAPFRLDGTSRTSSSTYELDFVHDGRRHMYGFEVDVEGIKREWMNDVPGSRWRTLLNRDRDEPKIKFHAALRGQIEVTSRELVLSRALLLSDTPLHAIAQDLVSHFDAVLVKDSHREARLRDIADSLAEKKITFADLEALLQVADIGVVKVGIEETKLPKRVRRALVQFQRDVRAEDPEKAESDNPGGEKSDELDSEQLEQVIRHLVFTHRGTAEECPTFSIQEESDGTIAWLATAVPALETLRQGGLLVVDEIDSSLHPHLLEVLLGAFADPGVNLNHSQLIFTSHESYVLSPLSEVNFEPEQVWFTDKSHEGVTELTCLADFPKHSDANISRRYLMGRYGGTPRLSPSSFAALIQAEKD